VTRLSNTPHRRHRTRYVGCLLAVLTLANAPAHAIELSVYFKALDKDGDERITFDELRPHRSLAGNFKAADTDGSGSLDLEEFEQLLALPTQESSGRR
jgi:hypothetical protein